MEDYRALTKQFIESNGIDWACYPFLPLKRWVDGKSENGFMIGNRQINFAILGHNNPTIYFGNMFGLKDGPLIPQVQAFPRKEYSSVDALLDDGWEVD